MNYKNHRFLLALAFMACFFSLKPALAQVVITTEATVYYDDNIYLESGELPPNEAAILGLEEPAPLPESLDGRENDDIVTMPSISLSSPFSIGRTLEGAAEARAGFVFFSDNRDENRYAIDSVVLLRPSKMLLDKRFRIEAGSVLNSSSRSISEASGAASRQAQTHEASLSLGLEEYQLSSMSYISGGYRFIRHDFLGEFTVDEKDQLIEQEGTDYFSNSVGVELGMAVSKRTTIKLGGDVDFLKFTNVESNLPEEDATPEEELDRMVGQVGLGVEFQARSDLLIAASAGASFTRYENDRFEQIVGTNQEGETIITNREVDSDETAAIFGGRVDYTPSTTTGFSFTASQRTGTDVSGSQVLTRQVGLSAHQELFSKVDLFAGASYLQFDESDSLSDAVERLESSAGARVALTPSLGLSIGWSFAEQTNDSNLDSSTERFLRSEEYTVHRFFITLSSGLVGVTS